MAIRTTRQIGDPSIRTKSIKVRDFTSARVKKTIQNLVDSMRHYHLVGMAAPQIGEQLRIFVTEIRKTKFRRSKRKRDALRIFINPRIIHKTKKTVSGFEGCGSVTDAQIFGVVPRASKVTVAAQDQNGNRFTLITSGLLARVIQHEHDHLNGIVFLDRITNTKTIISSRAYKGL